MLRYESEMCKTFYFYCRKSGLMIGSWTRELEIGNREPVRQPCLDTSRLTDNGYTNNVSRNSSPLTHSLI